MSETCSAAATSITHSADGVTQDIFAVRLGPRAFSLARIGIYILHGVCSLFYLSTGIFFIWSHDLSIVGNLSYWNVIIYPGDFVAVGIIHLVISWIHACFLLVALINARPIMRRLTNRGSVFHSRELSIHPKIRSTATSVYVRVFSRHGLLGIESRQFDSVLLVREVVETVVQSYQAYQMCRYLCRRRLIRLYVGTLVLNCWVTPVLHHTIKSKPLQRLLDRLLDVLLDFAASIGVPLIVMWTYALQFNLYMRDFPVHLYYDDTWSVTVRSESPIVFFGSWVDVVSRVIFSIGLLLALDEIKSLLHRHNSQVKSRSVKIIPYPIEAKQSVAREKQSRILRFGHRFLFIFGFAVLAVHIQSELVASATSCLVQLRPWFVSQRTCAVIEFDCVKDNRLTGDAAQFETIIGDLFATELLRLKFRHCHQIEIQSSIERFLNLTQIVFYNSTIRQWSADAAITATHHPSLVSIFFVRTNLPNGSLPGGLSSRDFPRNFLYVAFSMTNLTNLPEDLDASWASNMMLTIEFSELTYFPMTLTRMKLQSLGLAKSRITQVPAAAFEIQGMNLLSLSGNPLTTLPGDVNVDSLYALMVYSTNLTILPDWVTTFISDGNYVSAGRTPYCDSVAHLGANASSPDAGNKIVEISCVDSGPVTITDQLMLDV